MEQQLEQRIMERFERFEQKIDGKLDKLAEAIIKIARVEERQIQCQTQCTKTTDVLWEHVRGMEKRMSVIEPLQAADATKINFGERIWWILLAAAVGLGVALLKV